MSPADLQTPTLPSACALILALPMTAEEFAADLAAGNGMDYSRHHLLMGRSPDVAWEKDGASIAAAARQLAEVAANLGVLVCTASSLGCVAALFHARSVVTFVAHWRASSLRGIDFRGEPAKLVASIRAGSDELNVAIARRLDAAATAGVLAIESPNGRAAQLAELLNRCIINSDDPLPGSIGTGRELVYRPWLRMRHRQMLDDAFPDLLWSGNQVELRDGLHPLTAIADEVPPEWSGIVDLALCRSASAATVLKAGRSDRRIIFTHNEVMPQIRLRMLRELYRRLAEGGRNYGMELAWIFRELAS